jgi:2-dehydro-3-deoxyphosphogluconate aldolase / (4S)-4-hydroxy-2-oxoglutarate aldolase
MNTFWNQLRQHAVVPALVLDDVAQALPLARAMQAGGFVHAEVTLRTPAALECLRIMAGESSMVVGAGTVCNIEQAKQAQAAGATYIVSPGLDAGLVRWCQDADLPIIPGAVTPTEIMQAQELGLRVVKFFPCHIYGGLAAIGVLRGPFPAMEFLTTGGISFEDLPLYLSQPGVIACGGTWVAKREWLLAGDYESVTRSCAATCAAVQAIRHC